MATRGPRRRTLDFDSLERRETPSSGTTGVQSPTQHTLTSVHVAPTSQVVPLNGRGLSFQVTKPTVLSNGYQTVTFNLAGHGTEVSQFTGQYTPAIAPDGKSFLGSGYLYAANGGTIVFSATGTITSTSHGISHFQATFTVLGGTTTFLGVTGSGTFSGAFEPGVKTGDYSFHASITIPPATPAKT